MTQLVSPKSPWSLGDFHIIGLGMTNVGESLCDDCNVSAGARVLDLACGSGNTALSAARRGAIVTGIDLVDKLIDRAKVRAHAEGLSIAFETGNVQQLAYPDEYFDAVVSTFGVIFAPEHERTAAELLRVCKPAGTIGLSNWTVESFPAAMFALAAKYAPPPAGARPVTDWGSVAGLRRLFPDRITDMRLIDRCIHAHFNSADEMLATFKTYLGPMRAVFERIPSEQHGALEDDLRNLIIRYNRATNGTQSTAMSYVNVVLRKA
jgi:ubiquinone/menaquinone biosynthesis C-methylase UbiE